MERLTGPDWPLVEGALPLLGPCSSAILRFLASFSAIPFALLGSSFALIDGDASFELCLGVGSPFGRSPAESSVRCLLSSEACEGLGSGSAFPLMRGEDAAGVKCFCGTSSAGTSRAVVAVSVGPLTSVDTSAIFHQNPLTFAGS